MAAKRIVEHVAPFMQGQVQRIVAVHLTHDAIFAWIRRVFFDEGAEQAVPNDEYASVVLVEVFWVFGMVYAMVARGVEHPLQWPECLHHLGVDKKLIGQRQQYHEDHLLRAKAQYDQRHPE